MIDKIIFIKLAYQNNLPNKIIAQKLNISINSIQFYRNKFKLPPRKKISHTLPLNHPFRTGNFRRPIPWNKKLPDYFICKFCGEKIINKTGHIRKFCNYYCYHSAQKNGYFNSGVFKPKEKHWNYRINRDLIIRNNFNTFSYKQKKELVKIFNYKCAKCNLKFPKLPIYKLNHFVIFDHIVPIGLNGKNTIKNGQLLCKKCDKIKNSKEKLKIAKRPYISTKL